MDEPAFHISMTEEELYLVVRSLIEHCVGNTNIKAAFASALIDRLSYNLSDESLRILSAKLMDIEVADTLAKKASTYLTATRGGFPDPTNYPHGWPMGYGIDKSIWIELMDIITSKVKGDKDE